MFGRGFTSSSQGFHGLDKVPFNCFGHTKAKELLSHEEWSQNVKLTIPYTCPKGTLAWTGE